MIKGKGFPDALQENVTRPSSVSVLLAGLSVKTGSVGGSGKCHVTVYRSSWNNSMVMRQCASRMDNQMFKSHSSLDFIQASLKCAA